MKAASVFRPVAALTLAAVAAAFMASCASPGLKGTPLFTGEYEKPLGPPEERINAWPLLYYREPALSILWPFLDFSDDYYAIRPLYSQHRLNLDATQRQHNVLWPIAQFDRKTGENRIFPFFWDRNNFAAFPLYYHLGHPFDAEKGGTHSLFPLWIFFNPPDARYSLHLAWPFFNAKRDRGVAGGRLWPLYARWRYTSGRYYGWHPWPLGWHWGDGASRGSLLFPLYYEKTDTRAKSRAFYTLLAGHYRDPDSVTSYLLPLAAYARDRDSTSLCTLLAGGTTKTNGDYSWYATPALSWGYREGDRSTTWLGGPLYHRRSGPDSESSHLFPLYYHRRRQDQSLLLSLPYTSWTGADGVFRALVPPALSLYSRAPDRRDFYALAGLGHWSWGEKPGSSHLFPLYYLNEHFLLTPLYMRGRDRITGEPWSAIPPIYYHRDAAHGDTFLSPLYNVWTGAHETRHTLIPPLLTWLKRDADSSSLYYLAGLGKHSWGEKPENDWLLPLYYRDRDSFLSLPWSVTRDGGRTTTGVPLLLSWYAETETDRELRFLLGLAGRDWKADPAQGSASWVVPFYYRSRQADGGHSFLTLLAGHTRVRDGETLSYFPTPLVGWFRSPTWRGSWVIPLYFTESNPTRDTRETIHFPWGWYSRGGETVEYILWPLCEYENTGAIEPTDDPQELRRRRGRNWSLLYLLAYENSRVPRYTWNRTTKSSDLIGVEFQAKQYLFPLWSYHRALSETFAARTQTLEKDFSLLWFVQDYKRLEDRHEGGTRDYTRTRVLWRVIHYERERDQVALDVFPAITYDRTGTEKRKVSFLWRAFRYQRTGTEKAVDLLFLPVWRTRWAAD